MDYRCFAVDRCPSCRYMPLPVEEPEGACPRCRMPWSYEGKTFQWHGALRGIGGEAEGLMEKMKKVTRAAWAWLDPLSSPLSPISWLSSLRVDAYYRRCLTDSDLARRFGAHYLKGIELPVGSKILDYGCGRGRVAAILTQLGCEVVGQDVRPNGWWKRVQNAVFVVAPATVKYLPYFDGQFDLAVNVMVLGHIPEERLRDHISETYRVLKPGGSLLILEANSEGYGSRVPRKHYGRLHALDAVTELAEHVGFTITRKDYEGFYSPLFPRVVNVVRKTMNPFKRLVIEDYDSMLARISPPKKRGLWLLTLQK